MLALLAEPLTYAEIGARLFISARTVESHVISLRQKLGAADRRELVRVAGTGTAGRRRSGRLPAPLTTFVGRTAERSALAAALDASRLVTVAGPGGIGKTRLALSVADDVAAAGAADVTYVDLVPVTDGTTVASSVVATCGITEWSGQSAEETLANAIGDRPTLLVLDNCEHLVDGVVRLVELLLSRCAGLRVLITSRIRLVVPFERIFELGGLSADDDAVALFLERSGMADGDDVRPRVARICAALGGIALAIELAAARAASLGLDGLEAAIEDQLTLLVGGARLADRHRSLRHVLQWSRDQLDPVTQAVFRRVSTFAAPFTTAAAMSVTAFGAVTAAQVPAALATLCEHSLLTTEATTSTTRFRMLEPVRQLAMPELGHEHDIVRERHRHWCAASARALIVTSERGAQWCVDVDAIADDLRMARDAADDGPAVERGALGADIAQLLFLRGRLRDAQDAYERAVELAPAGIGRAALLESAAALAKCRVLGEEAVRLDEAAARAYEDAGASTLAARAWARRAEHASRFLGMYASEPAVEHALTALARARALEGGDPVAQAAVLSAQSYLDHPFVGPVELASARRACAAAEACGDPVILSSALDGLCAAHVDDDDSAAAGRAAVRRVAPLLPLADDPGAALELKDALHSAVLFLLGGGDVAGALDAARRHAALPFLRAEGDLGAEDLFPPLALSGLWDDEALTTAEAYRAAWERSGSPRASGRAMTPAAVALIHALRGDRAASATWWEVAAAMRGCSVPEAQGVGSSLVFRAIAHLDAGNAAAALELLAAGGQGRVLDRIFAPWQASLAAEAAALVGAGDADARIGRALRQVAEETVPALIAHRAAALHAADAAAVLATAEGLDGLSCPYQASRSRALASRLSDAR